MKKATFITAILFALISCTASSFSDMAKQKKEKKQKGKDLPTLSFTYLENELQGGVLVGDSVKTDYNLTAVSATATDILMTVPPWESTGKRLYHVGAKLLNPVSKNDSFSVDLLFITVGRITPGNYNSSNLGEAGTGNMRTWLGDTHWTSYTGFNIVVTGYDENNILTGTFAGEKVINGSFAVKVTEF